GPALDVFVLDRCSERGPNGPGRETAPGEATTLFGPAQLAWLKAALVASRATWKVLVLGQPIGLLILDDYKNPGAGYEPIATGAGPPAGRELEIAELLRFTRDHGVRNLVFLPADVHYAAAHHYDPARARFKDFVPFWEFVAGPLHAGTFGPNALDDTFGPKVVFNSVPDNQPQNAPPSAGQQFFGVGRVNASSRVLTIELRNTGGQKLYSVELPPAQLLGRRRRVTGRPSEIAQTIG